MRVRGFGGLGVWSLWFMVRGGGWLGEGVGRRYLRVWLAAPGAGGRAPPPGNASQILGCTSVLT